MRHSVLVAMALGILTGLVAYVICAAVRRYVERGYTRMPEASEAPTLEIPAAEKPRDAADPMWEPKS